MPAPHAAAPPGAFFGALAPLAGALDFEAGFFGSVFAGSAVFASAAGFVVSAGVAGVAGAAGAGAGVGVADAFEPAAADVSAADFGSGAGGGAAAGGAVSVEFTGDCAGFSSPPHAEITMLVPRTASAPAIFSTDRFTAMVLSLFLFVLDGA